MASTQKFELLCLENPLLDIQAQGQVQCLFAHLRPNADMA